MTISSTNRKAGPYAGNDVATAFAFAFKVFSTADVLVVFTSALAVESELTIDTDYTVSLNSNQDSNPGGTVTLLTPLATGTKLTLTSSLSNLQPVALTNNGGFYPTVINDAFDRATIQIQQLAEKVGRALVWPISSASASLPVPEANKFIGWNATADSLANLEGVAVGDAQTVAFTQAGTGAVTRTAQDKMREYLSVKDFSATGSGDETAKFNLAIAAISDGGKLECPYANYTIDIPSLVFGGKSILFDLTSGATINGSAVSFYSGNATCEYSNVSPSGVGWNYHERLINDGKAVGNAKVDGENVTMFFGGSSVTGGRHAIEATAILAATTNASNPDRNYVGVAAVSIASVTDGGVLPATPKGAVFGVNPVGRLEAGATGFLNVSAGEFNTKIASGASALVKTGIQIVAESGDAVHGTLYDSAVSLSNMSGAVGWKNGILFSPANGSQPIEASGSLIAVSGSATVNKGIDFGSYTFTTSAIETPGFSVGPSGNLSLTGVNSSADLGSKTSANTPFIDFNSSGLSFDYDARLVASGGSGSSGNGALTVLAGAFLVPPNFRFNTALGNYANDAAAAGDGVAINQCYRNGSVVQVRVS